MSETGRLIDQDITDFERALLRSAARDRPSDDARKKALAAMGLAAGAGSGMAAHAGITMTRAATPIIKWMVVAAIAGGTTVGAVRWLGRRHAGPPAAKVTAHSAGGHSGMARQPMIRSVVGTPDLPTKAVAAALLVPVSTEKASRPTVSDPRPLNNRHASAGPGDADGLGLGDEVAYLDLARNALAADQPARAVAVLDRYRAAFPHGALAEEATSVQVEALLKTGDRARAAALGAGLLAEDPSSPLVAHVRALLASSPDR